MIIVISSILFTIIALILSRLICKSLTNPFAVYMLIMTAQVLLYSVNLGYFESLATSTQLILLLCLISATFGFLTAYAIRPAGQTISLMRELKFEYYIVEKVEEYLILAAIVLLISDIILAYRTFITFGGIRLSIFAGNMDYRNAVMGGELADARGKYFSLIIPTLYTVGSILAPIHLNITNRFKFIHAAPIIGAILYGFLMMSRTHLVDAISIYIISFSLFNKVYPSKYGYMMLKKFIVFLLIFFLIYSYAVTSWTGKLEWSSRNDHLYIGGLPFISQVYDYFTLPLGKFNDVVIHDNPQFSFGWASFQPLYYLIYKVGLFDTYSDTEFLFEDYWLPIFGNVSPAIRFFYEDFGVIGVALLPYLFMLISTLSFLSYTRRFSITKHVFVVIFILAAFSTTSIWIFWYKHYFLILFIAFILKFKIRLPRSIAKGALINSRNSQ